MPRTQLFDFKHNNKTVYVYTGESSADVYYSFNGGSSKGAGIRWNATSGNFKSTSGRTIDYEDAQAIIRSLIAN